MSIDIFLKLQAFRDTVGDYKNVLSGHDMLMDRVETHLSLYDSQMEEVIKSVSSLMNLRGQTTGFEMGYRGLQPLKINIKKKLENGELGPEQASTMIKVVQMCQDTLKDLREDRQSEMTKMGGRLEGLASGVSAACSAAKGVIEKFTSDMQKKANEDKRDKLRLQRGKSLRELEEFFEAMGWNVPLEVMQNLRKNVPTPELLSVHEQCTLDLTMTKEELLEKYTPVSSGNGEQKPEPESATAQ